VNVQERVAYHKMIEAEGWTQLEKELRPLFESLDDVMPCNGHFLITFSDIDGLGVFVTQDFRPGDVIAPARIGAERSAAGRYANHSMNPNATVVRDGDTLNFIASRDITEGTEMTVDYRQVLAVSRNS
jgi:hypothetical protein